MILLWQHWLIKYRSQLGYDRSLGGVERFYLVHILAKGKQLSIASYCDNDLDLIYYNLLLDMVFVMLSGLTLPHSCACRGSICYLSLKFKLNYILIYIYIVFFLFIDLNRCHNKKQYLIVSL
jgi:hypothetical protein